MEIKTIEQAKELGLYTYSFLNGIWEYKDTDGYYHLMRNDKELLPEIKKVYVSSFSNGDWEYEDNDGYWHLFRDGEELLSEVKKLRIHSFPNGDWKYVDTEGYDHLIRDGEELLPDVKKKHIFSHPNGDWEYLDTNTNEWQMIKSDNIIKELEKKLEIANLVAEYWIKYRHNFFGNSAIRYHKEGKITSDDFIKIYEYYFENGGHSCDKEELDTYYNELKGNNKMVNE